ncbi:tripartite tricarboxylate transporter substrate binding protein [Arthrobacter sp. KFRI-F3372]|jgi:tripartite-type tricarboxylate transporter receptor subunit TctC|uniref:Tripartite-type tricarboxylate transporter receptor subunit TctC n=1 Tax=Pseudarthrobacter oxydans TaxID=1671 RepID=A0AAW8NCP1_PSEOX|nr:tripartite tricarboxylate transporter substrate binding protein [Pseudarthrobacter oxydans]MDR6793967.1 tripartite-type tricarboxylate transporter receptor subunit TctC [Pseudarthrobacter oxydans]MDR7165286.1 tripartite-type tricarboxylate transporter receptor subunit TctC [Pseudarthrobacter oxydans]MDV2982383.1 tripartite tricarboxylate transporter substrate binding protein [Actinomycetes bacterium ARC8]WHP59464.1 tripartite tricarboxylate transporter substrate binding protein [Arthrobacter
MNTRSRIAAALAAASLIALTGCGANAGATNAAGGDFPKKGKTIDLVVAFSSGGAVDTAARLIQPILEKELGTNVEVINKPGAGGQIGYTQLTSAAPDGYTIGATGSPSVVVSPLDPSRGAKYTRDSFQPLGRQVIDPTVIAVQPDSPYQTLKDLLDAAKANPKSMTASTTGLQTGEHFAMAQIQESTGSEFAPVHFSEGASQATTAFLGKHVDILVANVSDVVDLTKQGKARVLGVMTSERAPALPDVPTFKESGYDLEAGTTRGYSAPAGLPDEVAKKLEAAIQKAIEDPAVVQKMQDLGLQTSYLSGEDYKQYWAGQEEDFKKVLPLVQKTD